MPIRQMTLALAVVFSFVGPASAGGADDWNTFVIKDIKLGAPLKSLTGFESCGPTKGKYNVPLFKIVDKRCDKGSGNVCKVENKGSCGPTFNGKSAAHANPIELEYIQIIASTQTDDPRVYQIDYYFPRQFLSETSPLGQALKAKYGPHCDDSPACYRDPAAFTSDKVGGGGMIFKKPGSDLFLDAYCMPDNFSWGNTNQCRLSISDLSILEVDREKQAALDAKKNQVNQAKPPDL